MTISEEQLDACSLGLCSSSTPSGSKRRRSLCRLANETITKIRVLTPKPGELVHRRIHYPLDSISSSISQPSLESHESLSPKSYSREYTADHNGHALVSHHQIIEHPFTFTARPINHHPPIPNYNMAYNKQCLETCRLELICSKYQQSNINENAQSTFINYRLQNNSTNNSYQPGQLLFLKWGIEQQISTQSFT